MVWTYNSVEREKEGSIDNENGSRRKREKRKTKDQMRIQ